MDKDLNELCSMPVKMLLLKTKHKKFFTQKEFKENYGQIMEVSRLRHNLEKKLSIKEK